MTLCYKHGEDIVYEGKACPACEDVKEVKQQLEIAVAEKVFAEEAEELMRMKHSKLEKTLRLLRV
jgi:hypothetical protein